MAFRFAFAVLVALLLGPSVSMAASPTAELRGFAKAASRILESPEFDGKPDERFAAIRALAREIFDFHDAARLALGPDWEQRTPAERAEFVRLYSDFLERAFIAGIAARTQVADGVKVNFVSESVEGDTAVVRTTMLSRSGHDLPFDYRMVRRGDRWVIRDVLIDGVSMAANYRAQFARVIQTSSYPELIRQMQERVPGPARPAVAMEERMPLAEPVRVAAAMPDAATPPAITTARAVDTGPALVAPLPAPRREPPPAPSAPVARIEPAPPPAPPPAAATREAVAPAAPARIGALAPRAYWVQVAALKSLEAAMRLASFLMEGTPRPSERSAVVVEPASALARVRIGPFADRTEAAVSLKDLAGRGFKAFIAEEERR